MNKAAEFIINFSSLTVTSRYCSIRQSAAGVSLKSNKAQNKPVVYDEVWVLSQNAHTVMLTSITGNLIVSLLHWAKHFLTQWSVRNKKSIKYQIKPHLMKHRLLNTFIIGAHINADLRAKHVNVARPEGRQKRFLPGCFLCAFMCQKILEISPFTLRLLFTYGQERMLYTGGWDWKLTNISWVNSRLCKFICSIHHH